MPLYVPTSPLTRHHSAKTVQKGELYNLDRNERIGFQFNPAEFSWSQALGWSENNWAGVPSSDFNYLGTAPATFDLALHYLADPTAPGMTLQASLPLISIPQYSAGGADVDFDWIVNYLKIWLQPRPNTGMPSLLQVVMGERHTFEGIITNIDFKITRFFSDLSAREGVITISFREWTPVF